MKEGKPILPGVDGRFYLPAPHHIQSFIEAGVLESPHIEFVSNWKKLAKRRVSLNLGPGQKVIGLAIPVGHMASRSYDNGVDWIGGEDLPFDTGSVERIYAFHILEHLPMSAFYHCLHECERVLSTGGEMFIVVPYGTTDFALRAPDHIMRFTENTWRTMFDNDYAGKGPEREGYYIHDPASAKGWQLQEVFGLIAGTNAAKMCLYTILRKVNNDN